VGSHLTQLFGVLITGRTALHWAASVNSLEVTKELLRNGAKKDAQDEKVSFNLYSFNPGVLSLIQECKWRDL